MADFTTPRVEDWLHGTGCFSCAACCKDGTHTELQVYLSTDTEDKRNFKNLNFGTDSLDITFQQQKSLPSSATSKSAAITPRQKGLKDDLELPFLHTYPLPPTCSVDESEDERHEKLLDMYQTFALELHTGMYLTQLTSNRDYSDIHCQLMEDMQTLKLDQSSGRIIEFPLTGVSKVYRLVKNDEKWYSAGTHLPDATPENTEHIVVVEFMRRKLAFVFKELFVSQRFLVCMDLLVRRAQQKQATKALRPSPNPLNCAEAPSRQSRECTTPRQVRETKSGKGHDM